MQDMGISRGVVQSRMRTFRERILRLEQGELANLLVEMHQGSISRYETGSRPKSLDGYRVHLRQLARLVTGPIGAVRQKFASATKRKIPDDCSPWLTDFNHFPAWVECIFDGSETEWEEVTDFSLSFASEAPWASSRLLALNFSLDFDVSAISPEDLAHDRNIHGPEFIARFLRVSRLLIGAKSQIEWPRLFGELLTMAEAKRREDAGFVFRGPSGSAAMIGPRWVNNDDALWQPAMDFMAFILEGCLSGSGEIVSQERLKFVCQTVAEYRLARTHKGG